LTQTAIFIGEDSIGVASDELWRTGLSRPVSVGSFARLSAPRARKVTAVQRITWNGVAGDANDDAHSKFRTGSNCQAAVDGHLLDASWLLSAAR